MSYCRFSTDNFNCDIYAYESDFGFMIHVADNKPVLPVPKVDYKNLLEPPTTEEKKKLWKEQQEAQHNFLMNCERKKIGLEFDGETFCEPTLESFKERMLELRQVGYKFPDYVLSDIDEEIAAAN